MQQAVLLAIDAAARPTRRPAPRRRTRLSSASASSSLSTRICASGFSPPADSSRTSATPNRRCSTDWCRTTLWMRERESPAGCVAAAAAHAQAVGADAIAIGEVLQQRRHHQHADADQRPSGPEAAAVAAAAEDQQRHQRHDELLELLQQHEQPRQRMQPALGCGQAGVGEAMRWLTSVIVVVELACQPVAQAFGVVDVQSGTATELCGCRRCAPPAWPGGGGAAAGRASGPGAGPARPAPGFRAATNARVAGQSRPDPVSKRYGDSDCGRASNPARRQSAGPVPRLPSAADRPASGLTSNLSSVSVPTEKPTTAPASASDSIGAIRNSRRARTGRGCQPALPSTAGAAPGRHQRVAHQWSPWCRLRRLNSTAAR